MDFSADKDQCAQNMIKLAARGCAILAELQRLSQNIPKAFTNQKNNEKLQFIIFDFSYFNNIDKFEEKIRQNEELQEIDEKFKTLYLTILERFYTLFANIVIYCQDIKTFIKEVEKQVYIQYSIEDILQNSESKKLIAEIFHLLGCIFLMMDFLIPGNIREKLIISFFRYKGGQSQENMNDVCNLFKNTGYLSNSNNTKIIKRPKKYPDQYFKRFQIDEKLITDIILAIKDDDIYRNLNIYPLADHRSIALAAQAQIIFVLLYFVPDFLENQTSKMREITDKHFNDNWVISIYVGYTVDLSEQWLPYKAAKQSLQNTLDQQNVQQLKTRYMNQMKECLQKCTDYLKPGVLNEEFVLSKKDALFSLLRQCNVTFKWLLLQRTTVHKKNNTIINENLLQTDILQLILLTSKFEIKIQEIIEGILNFKQQKWDLDQKSASEKMLELSSYFSGDVPLNRIQKDQNLQTQFQELSSQIQELKFEDQNYIGRKIQTFIKKLEDIEQFHQIESNLQIRQYLKETISNLTHMVILFFKEIFQTIYKLQKVKIVSIKQNQLIQITLISDISYCWNNLKEYSQLMQEKIKFDPKNSLLLKFTFQKLNSIQNSPLVRLVQANSPDFLSVSKYYSSELLKFVKDILQIIPKNIFILLEELIQLLSNKVLAYPLKIERQKLKDYAQYEQRQTFSELTHQISVLTQSVLSMENYLLGILEVNPSDILLQGIKKELIKLIAKYLDQHLVFNNQNVSDFLSKLKILAKQFYGFKKAFEYIQDFVNIYGLKIFYDEFNRLIMCYIDIETNSFLISKQNIENLYLDDDIPIPQQSQQDECPTFLGRLLKQIIKIAQRSQYIQSCDGFYENQQESFGMKTLGLIHECIGVSGLTGLDRLLCFMIIKEQQQIIKIIQKDFDPQMAKTLVESCKELSEINQFCDRYDRILAYLKTSLHKIYLAIFPFVQSIGRLILIRKLICNKIQIMAKTQSHQLYLSLKNFNDSIINELIYNNEENQEFEQIQNKNNIIYELSQLLNFIGLNDVMKKFYSNFQKIDNMALLFFSFVHDLLPKLKYNNQLNMIEKIKKSEQIDFYCIQIGILVIFNQYHPSELDCFLGFLSQSIKTNIHFNILKARHQQESFQEIQLLNVIFEQFFDISGKKNMDEFFQNQLVQYIDDQIITK